MDDKNFNSAQTFYEKNVNYSFKSFENKNLLPHRYVFILTNLCNLACTFCFQERKKRSDRMSTENWLELLVGIMAFAKVVTNLTPTEKDNKIFGWLDTMIDALVPNYTKKK